MISKVLIFMFGILLGVIFFGGLWWTIKKSFASKKPAFWFIGSLLVRTGITLSGFYFIMNGRWERLIICLLGFIMARFILNRIINKSEADNAS